MFENFYLDLTQKFMSEIYDDETNEYNKDLITFIMVSIFIIYFIFSLISSFFKLPFILLLGTMLGMYMYNIFSKKKKVLI
jgi:hypothetical protein